MNAAVNRTISESVQSSELRMIIGSLFNIELVVTLSPS
jgi:hypothetical protein